MTKAIELNTEIWSNMFGECELVVVARRGDGGVPRGRIPRVMLDKLKRYQEVEWSESFLNGEMPEAVSDALRDATKYSCTPSSDSALVWDFNLLSMDGSSLLRTFAVIGETDPADHWVELE